VRALAALAAMCATAAAGGRVDKVRFHSDALGVDKQVIVYLPAGYDAHPDRHYPVFYYLHGLGGDETNWVKMGGLDAQADALDLQAIVVMPDGDDGFYVDSPAPIDYDACIADGKGMFYKAEPRADTCVRKNDYETYVIRDVIGWADKTYRTLATREGRAIAGLSMGGFAALSFALRYPDLFGAVASHSGVVALLYKGPHPYSRDKVELETDPKQWGKPFKSLAPWIQSRFGDDIAFWRARDPALLLDKLQPGQLGIYFDCGTDDDYRLYDEAKYLHDLLAAKNIEHTWFLGKGAHNFGFWAPRIGKSLAFLRDHTAKPKS
jgi:S-formylglutathione hydrolase FrmB